VPADEELRRKDKMKWMRNEIRFDLWFYGLRLRMMNYSNELHE
jgi:hypothetical protein